MSAGVWREDLERQPEDAIAEVKPGLTVRRQAGGARHPDGPRPSKVHRGEARREGLKREGPDLSFPVEGRRYYDPRYVWWCPSSQEISAGWSTYTLVRE